MTKKGPFTDAENAATVSMYFAMNDKATTGRPYNKAVMIKEVRGERRLEECVNVPLAIWGELSNRSRGSVEFKLMNCSAAHADLAPEAETMHNYGYRALPNYQASLKDAMKAELNNRWTESTMSCAKVQG